MPDNDITLPTGERITLDEAERRGFFNRNDISRAQARSTDIAQANAAPNTPSTLGDAVMGIMHQLEEKAKANAAEKSGAEKTGITGALTRFGSGFEDGASKARSIYNTVTGQKNENPYQSSQEKEMAKIMDLFKGVAPQVASTMNSQTTADSRGEVARIQAEAKKAQNANQMSMKMAQIAADKDLKAAQRELAMTRASEIQAKLDSGVIGIDAAMKEMDLAHMAAKGTKMGTETGNIINAATAANKNTTDVNGNDLLNYDTSTAARKGIMAALAKEAAGPQTSSTTRETQEGLFHNSTTRGPSPAQAAGAMQQLQGMAQAPVGAPAAPNPSAMQAPGPAGAGMAQAMPPQGAPAPGAPPPAPMQTPPPPIIIKPKAKAPAGPNVPGAVNPLAAPVEGREYGKLMNEGAVKTASEHLSQIGIIKDLRKSIRAKGDLMGPEMRVVNNPAGNITAQLLGGKYKDAVAFQSQLGLAQQIITKAIEGGVLRREDEKKYSVLVPQISDIPEVALDHLKQLEKIARLTAKAHLDSQKAAGRKTRDSQKLLDEALKDLDLDESAQDMANTKAKPKSRVKVIG